MKRYVVGVDVGGTNIKLGVVGPSGEVIVRNSFATKPFASHRNKLIAALSREIEASIITAGLTRRQIAGVGIGLPGLVDFEKGAVRFLPNIPGWTNVPLKSILQKTLKLPVYVDNDVKMITLAESQFGAGRGVKNFVCLTLGTGVGAGLILNGELYRGEGNAAGELGHMPLNEQGPRCNCGGWGCFETYVGNRALFGLASRVMKKPGMTTPMMFALAKKGNKKALFYWKTAAERIGNGLVGIVNLLNPRLIIIGGGVSHNEKFLFKTITATIRRRAMRLQGRAFKIKRAEFKDDAGIIGAYVLVMNAQR
ncbi:MAG: ROK family protein [Candidatus Omnitrophica bacterium]|nr:ROK family protein [Candidatus Omnitrophota bacterium]MDE2010195.1 ROK family protein [Candidatus Omnitrophota bacterium]MDE2215083.1 ROK family protein [Candidatus Omnitrophota bacterium]MDE2232405.1 ROK family protein [Candidatus Omnitrophota bacterium]